MYLKSKLIFILFLVTCMPCHAMEVTFLQHAQVSDSSILLADIAKFDEISELSQALGSQILTTSPNPGENKIYKAEDIIKTLMRITSLPPDIRWTGAALITVSRKGQEIGSTAILEAIQHFLRENAYKLPKAEIRFIASSLPLPFLLPEGKVTWEIVPSSPAIIDSSRVSLIIRVDGRVRKNISIGGKFEALAKVAVATVSLRQDQLLTPNNVKLMVKDVTNYNSPCTDMRLILGKRLKRSLHSGNVIELSNVEIPPLVHKGQLVKIIVNQGNIHLAATGIARANGKLNEIIRVRNTSSNKLIFCRVAAPGIVEVRI